MLKTTIVLLTLFSIAGCCHREATESRRTHLEIDYQGYVFEQPQPFAQGHASTLVHTSDDQFLVAWFGGTGEGNSDVAIWLAKGTPGQWEKPVKVAKINTQPHWNPVLFRDSENRIHLFFKVGPSPSEWTTWVQSSSDNGKSWGEARKLDMDNTVARGPVRVKPIVLSNGRWLAGSSDETNGNWNVFVDFSDDQGQTWFNTPFVELAPEMVSDRGAIQPTLWESAPGRVHMMARTTEDVIFRSDSDDYGVTWSPLYLSTLPNNNAGVDIVRMGDGTLVLAFNNLGTDGVRTPMNLGLSLDNGRSWPDIITLEHTPGSEFSYPAIIHVGDRVYGTYTWNRKRIAFFQARIAK